MAEAIVLTPGQEIKPKLDEGIAIHLVRKLYGLRVKKINELNAYDDKNYHVICEREHENPHLSEINEDGYVLKILNCLDSRNVGFVEAQNEMMLYLEKRNILCPVPVKNLRGTFYTVEKLQARTDEGNVVRLLVYRPGSLLASVPITIELLRDVGRFTARLDAILLGFSHPAYENRATLWTLSAIPRLSDFVYAIENLTDRQTVVEIIDNFTKRVITVIDELDCGIIHGDLNEQNIIVDPEGNSVEAIIDFGDTNKACLIFELAIAICYMILQSRDIASAKFVIEGFLSVRRLVKMEREILKICVCARLAQSLTLGAYTHSRDRENDYVLVTQKSGWEILRKLWPMDEGEVLKIWGLEET